MHFDGTRLPKNSHNNHQTTQKPWFLFLITKENQIFIQNRIKRRFLLTFSCSCLKNVLEIEMNVVCACLLIGLMVAHSTVALQCNTCFGESCRKSRGIPTECTNEVVEEFVKKLPIPIPPGVIGNINFKNFECLKVDGVRKCFYNFNLIHICDGLMIFSERKTHQSQDLCPGLARARTMYATEIGIRERTG